MGFVNFLKERKEKNKPKIQPKNPQDNPYFESIAVTVPVKLEGEEIDFPVRWIKDSEARLSGGQATFKIRGEKVNLTVSSPNAERFSLGVKIAIHEELVDSLREEVARLQEAGKMSAQAKISYVSDFSVVFLYHVVNTKTHGNVAQWQHLVKANLQGLIDDVEAVFPFIMHIYGE